MEEGKHKCLKCDLRFQHYFQLCKHVRIDHDQKVYQNSFSHFCSMCYKKFNNFESYTSHLRKCDFFRAPQKCYYCEKTFTAKNTLVRHLMQHKIQIGFGKKFRLPKLSKDSKFMLSKSAFKAYLQQYELFSEKDFKDSAEFLFYYKKDIFEIISKIIKKIGQVKAQFCLSVSFGKETEGIETYTVGYFCSSQIVINNSNQIEDIIERINSNFENQIQEFTAKGSGWYLININRLDIRFGIYNPLSGSCHGKLPKELINKKSIINIQNKDNMCFLYSVIAALHPAKDHNYRVSHYKKYIRDFNLENIIFPMPLNRIKDFEKLNDKHNIAINIFTWSCINDVIGNKKIVKPILTSDKYLKKSNTTDLENITDINLLLLDDHYFLIKNFNRLVCNFASNYHHICANCFAKYRTKSDLIKHKQRCLIFKPSISRMPKEPQMYFKQYRQMKKFPFVFYSDFESILKPENETRGQKTSIINKHIPCGYALLVIKNEDEIYYHNHYRGRDCMNKFLFDLKVISTKCADELSINKEMIPLTLEEEQMHQSASHCFLCKKPFIENDIDADGFLNCKVYEHDHFTGHYNGPAHNNCNINFTLPNYIPLFFHNLKGYDAHFIIKHLDTNLFSKCEIVPQNMEKFIAFKIDHIQILDSYQFLSESLDKLANNLSKSNYTFPITRKIFNDKFQYPEILNKLLYKKSIYPYEYMTDFDKFKERELPSKISFFSTLNQTEISDEDYSFAQNIWKNFNIQTLGDYHDFYVNLDTCLLADIFQAFRKTIYKEYELDPCHFLSIPGLAWSGALKVSEVKLELLTDVDDYQFFEMGVRGGMCGVNRRYCKANNEFVDNYNSKKPKTFLTYLDFNNLYGWAMDQKLPMDMFEWLTEKEYSNIDWASIDTEENIGYILEVDLEYNDILHDSHKDFPLAPHKLKIDNNSLSNYQKNTIEYLKNYGYRRTATEKLMQTLFDKDNYIIHFKNLKLYLQLGLKLKKIHRVIRFQQENFLHKYIEKNTILRQNANNDFEKDLFKLMNNSVFGKSIQDQRKHLNIKLALNEQQASKLLNKPNFTSYLILDENKTLINMRKTTVDLNRPIYIGFTVLELSKWLMYDRHYNYFKKIYGPRIELAYFDTDSYLYLVKTDNIINDLGTVFKDIMDFSNFDKDNEYFDNTKAKVIGFLKSEYGNKTLKEFVGLKAKLYSIIYGENENKNAAKGLQKAILKKFINHEHYLNVIKENNVFSSTSRRIQSKEHIISTIEQKKLIFTPMDDKRYILNSGIRTIPFGHKLLK